MFGVGCVIDCACVLDVSAATNNAIRDVLENIEEAGFIWLDELDDGLGILICMRGRSVRCLDGRWVDLRWEIVLLLHVYRSGILFFVSCSV